MNRHQDWSVIICLIGGGQEINTGEAGLSAWFEALRIKFPEWQVYVSDKITDSEYTQGMPLTTVLSKLPCHIITDLHLAVSLRSFRSEKVAAFVKALLDVDIQRAQTLYKEVSENYPILLTRTLQTAKDWVRQEANGTERYGLTASSGARRLRNCGVWVQSKIDATHWFLDGKKM